MGSVTQQHAPHWVLTQYYMALAEQESEQSSCLSKKVGTIVARGHHVLGSGYNETPHGTQNCSEGGCRRCQWRKDGAIRSGELREQCTCVHAERVAIDHARSNGYTLKGASLYVTIPPCCACAAEIKQVGITRVITRRPPHRGKGLVLLAERGVETIVIEVHAHKVFSEGGAAHFPQP